MFAPAPPKRAALPRALRLAAEGAGRRRRAQPARAARRHRQRRRARAATPFIVPAIAIRTGDTPAAERARFQREPADILITTPESLYLLLTSNAREALRVGRHGDHRRDPRAGADQARRAPGAVARAARGARRDAAAADRAVGDAAAARRGGAVSRRRAARAAPRRRQPAHGEAARHADRRSPSDAIHDEFTPIARRRPLPARHDRRRRRRRRSWSSRIEVPVEDMARLDDGRRDPERPGVGQATARPSIWAAIHPRLLELIARTARR